MTHCSFLFARYNKRSKDQEKAVIEQGLPIVRDSPSQETLPPPVPLNPSLLPARNVFCFCAFVNMAVLPKFRGFLDGRILLC